MKTRAKPSRTKINSLPQEILSIMAAYLPLKDFSNFRLTCKYFYEIVNCKMVMDKFKVCPPNYENSIQEFMKKVQGGKYINLVLTNFNNIQVRKILIHGPNLCSLSLQIQHIFKGIECLCPSLQHLYLDICKPLKHKGQRKLHYYFQALSEMPKLKTLALFGSASDNGNPGLLRNEDTVLPSDVIVAILENVKQINTLKLKHLHINIENDLYFQECVASCCHISTWSFFHVTTSWTGFKIPCNVRSLNCQFTNFVPIASKHMSLEKIIIITKQAIKLDNGILQVLTHDQESLYWTLYAKIKHGIISVESMDVTFFRVQLFNMPFSTISGFLDNDMNGVADAISELYINEEKNTNNSPSVPANLDNLRLISLLNKLNNLKYLELNYMDGIDADILADIISESMMTITIRKCRNFSQYDVNEKLKELNPSFKVLIVK